MSSDLSAAKSRPNRLVNWVCWHSSKLIKSLQQEIVPTSRDRTPTLADRVELPPRISTLGFSVLGSVTTTDFT